MEIDLNDDAQEEEGESNGGRGSNGDGIYMELWHACAGPHVSLPKKGSLVVYFPQGHLEQAQASSAHHPHQRFEMATHGLPPQVFCRVVSVQLHADKETDEVYTQVTLFPLPEFKENNLEGKEQEGDETESVELPSKSTPHMFCKTLTASDTSTHGGFSVPRRAAEDCFPPLDYKQQRPSQELTAKDLHGVEWKFRHIYRGQPRRHLLTTGWSIFVNQKNLVSGDAVLFLRGENGELRLGIRRAARLRNGASHNLASYHDMNLNVLSSAANAISTNSNFHVFYSPRASPAEFVIPYRKYINSISHPISVGMRFKMRFEMEDAVERRYSGVISAIGDVDPLRWSESRWRCLTVTWDEDIVAAHHERVSPWEIEPSISQQGMSIPCGSRLKKLRTNLPLGMADVPLSGSQSHFGGSVRSAEVLQGQESVGFGPPYDGGRGRIFRRLGLDVYNPLHRSLGTSMTTRSIGFEESARFQKVLQGQEISPVWGRSLLNVPQGQNSGLYVHDPNPVGNMYLRNHLNIMPNYVPVAQPYLPNFQTGPGGNLSSCQNFKFPDALRSDKGKFYISEETEEEILTDDLAAPTTPEMSSSRFLNDATKTGCKLFGFSLTGEAPLQNTQNSGRRSCTKVHKQGNPVGRAIDLSKLHGYHDLLRELERLFHMEGLLCNSEKGWQVVYTDSENDMMLVGDDPWDEFCDMVCKIHIYTREEVEKMTLGMNNDDAHSCLEEAAAVIDVSKSSSPGPQDSSLTVTRP
ncbi:auxin response factor 4-like [Aristolochia californica]|uniref:auxin response factor 4-like n=1 Tax=Aristolochia californica TaxID=171875 RepID=UPI0035DF6245